jgi:hypothetical protein
MSLFYTEMKECVCLGYWLIYIAKDMKTIRSGSTGVESHLSLMIIFTFNFDSSYVFFKRFQGRDKKNSFKV